ncbi:toxin-antitoxin system YwqK family antitoxin [Maribacter sp. IgM3_T14_3]|uniref:toxin-antitoxin system YwqK family antitoxin n=1 Tax=Maribacter sp. IgM3_T14_3 TaxID=3415140 RepID=UPI003C6F63A4
MRIKAIILCLFVCLFSCNKEKVIVDKANDEIELVNGVLFYQNTPFNGLLVSKYDDSTFKTKLEYVDGRKDGYEKQWYPNGQLSQTRWYTEGLKTGNHIGWWEDGLQKFSYQFNEKGEYEGNRKEWYRNGKLILDFNYYKGKEIGSQRMWTDSGKIRANYVVKNGERFGLIGLKKCYSVNIDSNDL